MSIYYENNIHNMLNSPIAKILILISFIIFIIEVISKWTIFVTAGKPGWHSLIPFLRTWDIVDICISDNKVLCFILLYIPAAQFITAIYVNIKLAESFGKGVIFGLGLTFFSFFCIPALAFSDSYYHGYR